MYIFLNTIGAKFKVITLLVSLIVGPDKINQGYTVFLLKKVSNDEKIFGRF